jgi:tRNA G46 methylase TrmB
VYNFLKSKISVKIKANLKNLIKHSKTRSFKEFSFKESFLRHNSQYSENEAFNREFENHKIIDAHTDQKKGYLNNIYEQPNSVGYFLDNNRNISKLIDIGSGTGWFVNYVSKNHQEFKNIIAIEPSKFAIKIAQKIYKHDIKIEYKNGFTDEELKQIDKDIYLITTFAVFLHLNYIYTKKVLKILNNSINKDSILIFNEPIAKSRYERFNLHYPRSKKFWIKNLKHFEVNFYNDNLIVARKIV